MSKFIRFSVCALLSLALSACFIRPYKFDIEQGNVVTSDKVSEVRPGMSEEQVRYVLGSPMLTDIFHKNRWDYIYYDKPGYAKATRFHVAIYFEQGQVSNIIHDPSPAS